MRKPPRLLVVSVAIPFLAGCTSALMQPLPEPAQRQATDIRGVVLGDPESGERIEYGRTEFVEWTDSTVAIHGFLRGDARNLTAATYQLSDVGAILVQQIDANRTSILVGGFMVGIGVLAAVFFTGFTTDQTILRVPGGG